MAKLSAVVPSNEVEVEGVKYRKVERKAQAGDIVKALTAFNVDVDRGAFYSVTNDGGETGFYDNVGDFRHAALRLRPERFEVYEKVTEPATVEYREVKRVAKVGERIRIVNLRDDRYSTGDEFVVREDLFSGDVGIRHPKHGRVCVLRNEYVVLEPVNDAKPAPQPERLKVGEYAKVVVGDTPFNRSIPAGAIVEILVDDRGDTPFKMRSINDGKTRWAKPEHIIRATESEVEAAKKAAERAKKIGEFADGGYAEIVNANLENSSPTPQKNNGAYVKVAAARPHSAHPLRVTLSNGEYGICNADALRKVSREEYEDAMGPRFKVGELARTLVGKDVPKGAIVKITEDDRSGQPYRGELLDGSDYDWYTPEQLEKVSEEEAKWAAIGRKVNEYKAGDLVKCVGLAKFKTGVGEIVAEDIPLKRYKVRYENPVYNACYEGVGLIELLAPVEQRFDRAEGGADLSK